MNQVNSNSREQALLGDLPGAMMDAIIGTGSANENQSIQLLSNPEKANQFLHLLVDMMQSGNTA